MALHLPKSLYRAYPTRWVPAFAVMTSKKVDGRMKKSVVIKKPDGLSGFHDSDSN
jgi:hypothetical protein